MDEFRIPLNDKQKQFLWFAIQHGNTTPFERDLMRRILRDGFYTGGKDKEFLLRIRESLVEWFEVKTEYPIFIYGYPYFYGRVREFSDGAVYDLFYYNSRGEKKVEKQEAWVK